MNKVKILNEQERIKLEFDFENIEVAKEYFSNEDTINDVVDILAEYDNKEELNDNDMLRASVQTQVSNTSSETLKKMLDIIQDELNNRK